MPSIALVDCNNFFVSCESVFNPKLKNRPVVVLSNNDGCAISRSEKAKAIGIAMGAPYFQFADLLKRHQGVALSSNFSLYTDMSCRIMSILAASCLDIDIYSIDEAFLILDDPSICSFLRAKILQWTGIAVSIGVAPTKTLAKIAARQAKNSPEGICYQANLCHLPLQEIWGIGKKTALTLASYGVFTASQLLAKDDLWIKKVLGVAGFKTVLELKGQPVFSLDIEPSTQQSILYSRSFSTPISSFDLLKAAIAHFIASAAIKMRRKNLLTKGLSIFISPKHQTTLSYFIPLEEPTDYTPTLLKAAANGLLSLFKPNTSYRRAGVTLCDLTSNKQLQKNFLAHSYPPHLMRTVDQINRRFGKKAIHFASEGAAFSKQNNRSPHYTTNINEILTIKVDNNIINS